MNDTPYFSIIIPMYNVARYIKLCINSILNQTFKDFEIIIVDDVSTDDSYDICSKLYGDNNKVRLFRQEKNQGPSVARNFGLKKAVGKWIWFIDSDDAIVPDALEKLFKATQAADDIDAVHIKGWYRTNQDDDKPLNIKQITSHWENNKNVGLLTENIPRRLAENWATHRIAGFVCNTIYRREFLSKNKIEFFNCLTEDQVFHFEAFCLIKHYFMLHDSVYIYRIRQGSLAHSNEINICKKGIKSLKIISDKMNQYMDRIPELENHRILREQCITSTLECVFRDFIRRLYHSGKIQLKFDQAVYETLLPIFGENTTLVKYLFHGFNTMWRQANILARKNYSFNQLGNLVQQQQQLLNQMNLILNPQSKPLPKK